MEGNRNDFKISKSSVLKKYWHLLLSISSYKLKLQEGFRARKSNYVAENITMRYSNKIYFHEIVKNCWGLLLKYIFSFLMFLFLADTFASFTRRNDPLMQITTANSCKIKSPQMSGRPYFSLPVYVYDIYKH